MAVRLECAIKNYHWGKVGSESAVARFGKNNREEFTIAEDEQYAELWMGTLASGPSMDKSTGLPLGELIAKSPSCLGATITENFGEQLPFLFKVLSVNLSLSIQAHPNKSHAEELNRKHPDLYKDPNHKPEMALAVTDFEGLCGFRPFSDLQSFVKTVPELAQVIGPSAVEAVLNSPLDDINSVKSAVKSAFSNLMRCNTEVIQKQVSELVERIKKNSTALDSTLTELIPRLNRQFPGDVGIFSVFFLNHMMLRPGEAMFLAANTPHAYLYGDCVECMATSDNVVRAGLTPKFKDVDTLIEMLDYTPKSSNENVMTPSSKENDPCATVFNPPVPDFAVLEIKVPAGNEYALTKENSASIIIVIRGNGSISSLGSVKPGHVFFLPANEELTLTPETDILMYRALCLPV